MSWQDRVSTIHDLEWAKTGSPTSANAYGEGHLLDQLGPRVLGVLGIDQGLQFILNNAIESLDQSIGLGVMWSCHDVSNITLLH